ncbi:allograft inflammatory factor 1-like [Huso huso]|uniref:Allograft inflammatory factor 1-like n=1 Tax=Huso huso TaxID=61971 RepID=A0ABR0ZI62_HUSHU
MRQKQEAELSAFNKEFLADLPFLNIPDLRGKLERLKWKFIEHDPQHSGEIDLLVLGCTVQELGSPGHRQSSQHWCRTSQGTTATTSHTATSSW